MKWKDIIDISCALCDKFEEYSAVDIKNIPFTKLHSMVCELDQFNDLKENCNEKILEAIQFQWLEEIDEK